jgi:hypothetical protein
MAEEAKGILITDLDSAAMARERDDWGYYVRAIRDLTHPSSWRWRIIRRGNPMGVLLEAGGFNTYEAARTASCPVYPQSRPWSGHPGLAASCHKQTFGGLETFAIPRYAPEGLRSEIGPTVGKLKGAVRCLSG